MRRKTTTVTVPPEFTETLIIRMAVPGDAPALRRLAQLDSAPPPEQVPMLVAVVDGDVCAALPLSGGTAIATPSRASAADAPAISSPAFCSRGSPSLSSNAPNLGSARSKSKPGKPVKGR